MVNVILEFFSEVLQETLDRPGRRITQGTDRASFYVVGQIDQHIQILVTALPQLDTTKHPVEPTRALTARRALTAALVLVEVRDALNGLHDVGGFVHHRDGRSPERRVVRLEISHERDEGRRQRREAR